MAKKAETPNMVEQFAEFKELKNIDKTTMISVLEESFRIVLAKMFGDKANIDVILNPDKGDVQIFLNLEVVPDGEVENPNLQISLSDARADDDPEAEIGEEHSREIIFEKFGRRAILNLRQTLQTRILDLQKEAIYAKFKEMEGELVSGEVYQRFSRETLLVDADNNELLLPRDQSIPGDDFHKGQTIRAVIANVDNKNNNPKITVSRTNNAFLVRLFELEVPEIHDGLISIKAVARIPGRRAKIAVESYDDRIDPVGACVGVKGSRIHGIVRELNNENIDVINYTSNPALFIQRALSPARVSSMRIDEENKKAEIFLRPEEVSLAIGKNGDNIKLATKLTGYEIDVYRETEQISADDIFLDQFRDEIDGWIVDQLKSAGYLTAFNVLNASREEVIEKADLEEDTVDEVFAVLSREYEEESVATDLDSEEDGVTEE